MSKNTRLRRKITTKRLKYLYYQALSGPLSAAGPAPLSQSESDDQIFPAGPLQAADNWPAPNTERRSNFIGPENLF
jgi:hypothetical protein